MSPQFTLSSTDSLGSDLEKFILEQKNKKHFISSFYSLLGLFDTYVLPDISWRWEKGVGT